MVGAIRESRTNKPTLVILHNGTRYDFDSIEALKVFLEKILSPVPVQ
jgi:hypothetical protein